jgi:hypothetical protein
MAANINNLRHGCALAASAIPARAFDGDLTPEELNTRVSLSLHPLSVTKLDGYNDKTKVYAAGAERVLHEAYSGVSSVFAAMDAAKRDPTLNDSGRILKVDDMAQRVFAKVAKQFDTERSNLERGIAQIEAELSAPIAAKASHFLASEVRAFVRDMKLADRAMFIRNAILNGDDVTASAVLGAPAYLSGIDPEMMPLLVRTYHEQNAPEVAAKLTVMQGAKALLEERGGLLFHNLEQAVGAKPHEVKNLREAKNRSDKAFAV